MCKQWVNQAAVPTERLMQMLVPLPPLEQQRRIAAILDEADGLRTMRRAALAQLDEMAQAIFVEMFGDPESNPKCWPISQLHEIVRLGDNINYGVVQPGDQVDGGVPLVRVGDLSEGRVDRTNIKTIAPEIEADYRRSRLRGDEVLVSCVGSIGVVALACADDKGSNIARAVARIPVGNLANRVFLANYLRSNFVQNYFTRELRTVSQPTLNIKQIAETPVLLPPLPLQSEFAERWATLQHLVADWSTRGAMLDSLFASLQHRAFRGEL
ncbi:Type I restriction modification DNA specificity domain-containing protein [Falsiroseomonas stagni DSM 19981]|uniref:Type I restriction modification DNA specificity domain-containing protein n=2 Tax=Falsiroseomonas TaxID=2870713 RepID=A0A1I3XF62_9PROT|nr:Type I restriction modification DNA specificity domain-containing protein [Falsiroseomonas stagni DSM 19981]